MKILKSIIYFSLILFSSVLMIESASARTLDHVPPVETLSGYTSKYIIVNCEDKNFWQVRFEENNFQKFRTSVSNGIRYFSNAYSDYSTTYIYPENWSDSWVFENSGRQRPYYFMYADKYNDPVGSSNVMCTNYRIMYTTVDVVEGDTVIYPAGYDYFEDETGIIRFDTTYNSDSVDIRVDFSDFLEDGINVNNYIFAYEDETTDGGYYVVTPDLIMGIYNRNVKYKVKMTAKVLDQNKNVIAQNTLNLHNADNLIAIYQLTFPINRNISLLQNYPQDRESQIIKHVSPNMTEDNYKDLFELWEQDFFFGHEYVAIGFFTDEELTQRVYFDGTWAAAHDMTIYSEWSNSAPSIEPYLQYNEEYDEFRLYFNFDHWNNSDYRIAYRNGSTNFTYSDQTSSDIYQIVDKLDIVELEYFSLENGTPQTLAKYYIHVGQVLSADEELFEQVTTNENIQNDKSNIEIYKSILNGTKTFINGIKEVIAYFWTKCNIWIKWVIITWILSAIIVATTKLWTRR